MSDASTLSGSVGSFSSVLWSKLKKPLFHFPIRWATYWDYISFTLAYLVTPESITSFHKVGLEDGNVFQYMVIYLFVALPMFYMQLVLGQYTQASILYSKYMIPLSHGLSYTMLLTVFYQTLKQGYHMTDFLLYFLTSMQVKLPWMQCPKNIEPGTCYNGLNDSVHCNKSCLNNHTKISSHVYLINVYMDTNKKHSNANILIPNIHRLVALLVSWIITFFFVYGAYKKRRKILSTLLCIAFLLMMILITGTVATAGGMMGVHYRLAFRVSSVYSLQTWMKMCSRIMVDMSLGQAVLIFAGSRLKHESHAGMLSVFCCILASISSFFCSLFLQSCIGIVMKAAYMTFSDFDILKPEFSTLSFLTHIPQALGYLSCPQMWTVAYFFCILCALLCNQIIRIMTIQVSLSDMHPGINRFQVYVLGLFCALGVLIGFAMLGDQHFVFTYSFMSKVTSFTELFNVLVLSITVFWIYGVRRLCDDIHFLTGSQPTKFWKLSWYTIPVVIAVSCYYEYICLAFSPGTKNGKKTFTFVFFLLSTSPIPIFVGIEIFRHIKARNLLGLFQPADMWGPSDPEQRHKRQMFNPRTENRFKSHQLCQHTCLLNSKFLKSISAEESQCRDFYLETVSQRASTT